MKDKEYYSIYDVMQITGLTYQWIYHLIRGNKIKAKRIKRKWLIDKQEVEKLIKERK